MSALNCTKACKCAFVEVPLCVCKSIEVHLCVCKSTKVHWLCVCKYIEVYLCVCKSVKVHLCVLQVYWGHSIYVYSKLVEVCLCVYKYVEVHLCVCKSICWLPMIISHALIYNSRILFVKVNSKWIYVQFKISILLFE